MAEKETGSIGWRDLTVTNAEQVRDFYAGVVGWKVKPISMGDYQDYSMQSPTSGQDMAGICHLRGINDDLPAQWLMYILVDDLDQSVAAVAKQGGKVLTRIKHFSATSRYAVIEDPAGAVCAIYEEKN